MKLHTLLLMEGPLCFDPTPVCFYTKTLTLDSATPSPPTPLYSPTPLPLLPAGPAALDPGPGGTHPLRRRAGRCHLDRADKGRGGAGRGRAGRGREEEEEGERGGGAAH